MEFTDQVPKVCKVVVEGCPISLHGGFGGDMRLGAIVLDLLCHSGHNIKGLEVENLGLYFAVVEAIQGSGNTPAKITVRQIAVPEWVK